MGLTASVVDSFEDLMGLRGEWEALLADSDRNVLPLNPSWVIAWWESFREAKQELTVALVRDGNDELVAIAPSFTTRTTFRKVPVSRVSLMANDFTPYSGIAMRRDVDPRLIVGAVLGLFFRDRGADLVELTKIHLEGPEYRAVADLAPESSFLLGHRPHIETPYIPVESSWDDFLSGLSWNFRKRVRKRLRRLEGDEDLCARRLQITGQDSAGIADMVDVSARSWKGSVKGHIDGHAQGRAFLMALFRDFGPKEAVTLWELSSAGRPIAFELQVGYEGVAYPLRADYVSDFSHLGPGELLRCHILESLFEEGEMSEYNTGGHTYDYLLRWSRLTRWCVDLHIFPKQPRSVVLHAFEYRFMPIIRKLRGL